MKNLLFLILIACFVQYTTAQQYTFAVYLSDKEGTPYSISEPGEFLSQKSIDRREKFNIPITSEDLPVSPVYVSEIESYGFVTGHTSKWLNTVLATTPDSSSITTLENLPFVLSTVCVKAPDSKKSIIDKFGKESLYAKSTSEAQNYDYGSGENQIAMLNGIAVHEAGFRGEGMIITVLDGGFQGVDITPCFDLLFSEGRLLGTRDFVVPGGNVYDLSLSSHGTSVLSTMAAILPGQLVGTAPQASYYLFRTEDTNSEMLIEEYNWVSGAELADSLGTDVINSSLGYTEFDIASMNHTYADMNGETTAISIGAGIAVSKGMVVVNSAGNSGNDPWHYIGAPADAPAVLSIGAVKDDGTYASFSSTGPNSAGIIKPNVVAQGQGTTVTSVGSATVYQGNGTSFSSPVTAGMVACLLQSMPNTKPAFLCLAIEMSASQYDNPDSLLGYGIPNYFEAMDYNSVSEENEKQTHLFSIAPNPAQENITLRSDQKEAKSLTLFSVSGAVLLQKENLHFPYELSLADFPKGVYFIQIEHNSEYSTEQLILQ